MNLIQKIAAISGECKIVVKDKEIEVAGRKYKVVTHDAVTSVLRPIMAKHGVVAYISKLSHVDDDITVKTKYGETIQARTKVDIEVTFSDGESSISTYAFAYGIDPSDKAPGKAVSYAFKYALLKTFNLETGDDTDNEPSPEIVWNQKEKKDLIERLKGQGQTQESLTAVLGYWPPKHTDDWLKLKGLL